MMENEPIRIFISSIFSTYERQRQAAIDAISDLANESFSITVVRAEDFPSQDPSPQRACLEGVGASNIYLGIFGSKYSHPTFEEYQEALKQKKPCILFEENGKKDPVQKKFLQEIKDWEGGHFINFFGNPDDLKYKVSRALRDLIQSFLPLYLKSLVNEFGKLQLTPLDDQCFPIDQIVPLRLAMIKKDDEKESFQNSQVKQGSFSEVIKHHEPLIVISPSGSGKTVGLRQLVFELAKESLKSEKSGLDKLQSSSSAQPLLPIYIHLLTYQGSLIEQIRDFVGSHGIRSDTNHVKSFLKNANVLLMLDGFDEVTDNRDKQKLLADIKDLKRAYKIRYMITTRTIGPATVVGGTTFEVSPFEDGDIEQVFCTQLGVAKGQRLFQLLDDRRLVDPFRRPMMTWFVASAYKANLLTTIISAQGWLYQKVFEDYFFKKGKKITLSLVGNHEKKTKLKLGLLMRLAYEMLQLDRLELDEVQADGHCEDQLHREGYHSPTELREALLSELFDDGLIERCAGMVRFWHPSFRDYFASCKLKEYLRLKQFGMRQIAKLSKHSRWHESIIFLCGILDDSKARMLLSLLV
ncbi:MAG: DUF4062 domain-containing protein [Waddliaceae bacterium]